MLIVDDDVSARQALTFALAVIGRDFLAAENGREGIRLAHVARPQVAIVDLRLPDLSGIEVLSAIRTASPSTVLVLLTAYWTLKTEFDAKNAGAWACLEKPLFVDELHELVDLALGVRAALTSAAEVSIVRVQPAESHAAARLVERLIMFIAAPKDEPTLRGFGRATGVSRGGFRNWCRTAGLKPLAVRNFARGLRVAWHLQHDSSFEPPDLLDIVDERTLRRFYFNSGTATSGFPRTVDEFLTQQTFITNQEFVATMRAALGSTRFEAGAR